MPGADPTVAGTPAAVSVVVPTCRPVDSLGAMLDALGAQSCPPGAIEVVVVLDGPDDGRSAILRDRDSAVPVVVVHSTGRGRAAACNAGVRQATGEVVLLLDDDMVPEHDAVASHLARHATSDAVAVVGAAPVDEGSSSLAARYIGRRFDRHLAKLAHLGSITDVRDVYTGSFSVRRTIFLDVGGFDERFTEYGNEDGELAGRLLAAGVRLVFAGDAVTRQGYSKTFAQLAADNVAKGWTAHQFLARHPDRSAESAVLRRHGVAPARRLVRAILRRLVASPGPRAVIVGVTERVAGAVEPSRPVTADRIIDVLLDGCFWAGVTRARTSAPAPGPLTVVHYTDGQVAGGVERMALTLLALTDRERWRPVLFVHESPALAPTIRAARDHGVQVEVLPPRSGPKGLWTILGLAVRLRTLRPAVVHVHRSWAMSGTAGVVAAAAARCKVVVVTEHLFNPATRARAFRVRRVLDRAVHRHVAVSGSLGVVLRERFGLPERAVEVVHNGVLPPDRPPAPAVERLRRQWLTEHAWAVLVPARLDRNKGHATLLAALRGLPQVVAVLAGEGPERERLERLAGSLGVTDRVQFLGHRDDVPALMTAADVVVLPSNAEGLPLVLLEASALGRPIVACDVDGVGEIVEDGVSGVLTPSGDPEALAGAIRAVLDDPEGAARMGEAAREHFRQRFQADRMVRAYEQLYDRLLASGVENPTGAGAAESASLRKLDWRFLAGQHHFPRAAQFSAAVEVEGALGRLCSVASEVVSGVDADPASVDLAVAVGPSVTELRAMDAALRDGGVLVFVARGTSRQLLSRWRAAALPYDVRLYTRWAWAGRTRAWLPVDDSVARLRVSARPLPQPRTRKWLRAWAGWWRGRLRWWRRSTPVAELVVVARKPGPAVPTAPTAPAPDDWRTALGQPPPSRLSFTLLTGGRESISKAVGLLSEASTLTPGVVVKWPRTAVAGQGLAREGSNLRLLERRGAGGMDLRVPVLVREHPTDVGPALVESMLDGAPLVRSLNRATHRTVALRAADVLSDLARQTADVEWSARDAWWRTTVAPIENRFIELVGDAVDPQLLARARRALADLDALPGCMEHRDMGPWNILVDGDGVWQAADWESSVGVGLPFTDLWYFLTWAALSVEHLFERSLAGSYPRLTDPMSPTGRVSVVAVERYAAAVGLDRRAVNALRMLTWMIHVPSEVGRLQRAGTPLRSDTLRRATFVQLWEHEVRRHPS